MSSDEYTIEKLEEMIDEKSLSHVLGLLSDICEKKSDNCCDEFLELHWGGIGNKLLFIAERIEV